MRRVKLRRVNMNRVEKPKRQPKDSMKRDDGAVNWKRTDHRQKREIDDVGRSGFECDHEEMPGIDQRLLNLVEQLADLRDAQRKTSACVMRTIISRGTRQAAVKGNVKARESQIIHRRKSGSEEAAA